MEDRQQDEYEIEYEVENPFALKRDMRNVDWMGTDASPFRLTEIEDDEE
jgi:hypothetical protein